MSAKTAPAVVQNTSPAPAVPTAALRSQRRPPAPLRELTPAFEIDAQAHADYWREAFAAVQDSETGIISLVTNVRAPFVDNTTILKRYRPTDAPAEQWPRNPLCHAGLPPGIETIPGFREMRERERKQPLTPREEAFTERSPGTLRTSNAARAVISGGRRTRLDLA